MSRDDSSTRHYCHPHTQSCLKSGFYEPCNLEDLIQGYLTHQLAYANSQFIRMFIRELKDYILRADPYLPDLPRYSDRLDGSSRLPRSTSRLGRSRERWRSPYTCNSDHESKGTSVHRCRSHSSTSSPSSISKTPISNNCDIHKCPELDDSFAIENDAMDIDEPDGGSVPYETQNPILEYFARQTEWNGSLTPDERSLLREHILDLLESESPGS